MPHSSLAYVDIPLIPMLLYIIKYENSVLCYYVCSFAFNKKTKKT